MYACYNVKSLFVIMEYFFACYLNVLSSYWNYVAENHIFQ